MPFVLPQASILRLAALPILCVACTGASSRVPPSVVVTPLLINTYVREVPGVGGSARYFAAALEGALAADSSIQWVPRVANTPPDSTTGNPRRPQYVVAGVLTTTTGDTLVLAWRLTSLETAEVVASGRLSLVAGWEPDLAAKVARLVAATLRKTRNPGRSTWLAESRGLQPGSSSS